MEINKVIGDIVGVIAKEDLPEGRMVVFTSHTYDVDFGSQTDLPGAALPADADSGKRARHIVTWAVDNRKPPYFVPMPAYSWALRRGFGSAANVPFSASVWLTWPGMQKGQTIPSGFTCLAYGAGTYTVPSGNYIYSAGIKTPGALLSVSYAAATKGELQLAATFDADVVVAKVIEYESTTGDLTFTTMDF